MVLKNVFGLGYLSVDKRNLYVVGVFIDSFG